jgi:hypothetical protein
LSCATSVGRALRRCSEGFRLGKPLPPASQLVYGSASSSYSRITAIQQISRQMNRAPVSSEPLVVRGPAIPRTRTTRSPAPMPVPQSFARPSFAGTSTTPPMRVSTGILRANSARDRAHPVNCHIVLTRVACIWHEPIDVPDLNFGLHMTPCVTASSNYMRRELRNCPAPIGPTA